MIVNEIPGIDSRGLDQRSLHSTAAAAGNQMRFQPPPAPRADPVAANSQRKGGLRAWLARIRDLFTLSDLRSAIIELQAMARGLQVEMRDANNRIDTLRRDLAAGLGRQQGELNFLRRRIVRLDDLLARTFDSHVAAAPSAQAAAPVPNGQLDIFWEAFDMRFRGSAESIRQRLEPYLDPVKNAAALRPGRPVLDIACGRGQWLELLRNAGVPAYGIDSNSRLAADCCKRGLDVRAGDALTHIRAMPDGAFGVVTAFHFVEHLPFAELLELLGEIRRVLAPDGLLIIETPNPESIKVGATTFYTDPTHVRPLPPVVGEFMLETLGFTNIRTLRLNPYPDSAFIREGTEAANRINELMYGPQDYALIATAPGTN